jgi:hypothetical protein
VKVVALAIAVTAINMAASNDALRINLTIITLLLPSVTLGMECVASTKDLFYFPLEIENESTP